jgi:PAS domain S-box-containing protein
MAYFSPQDKEQMLVKQQAEIADLRARLATAAAAENTPLRVRERQARLILDEMYQVVILLDTQGNEIEINQSSLDIRTSSPKDRIGKPPWKRMQPASAAKAFQDAILSVIATGEFKRFELEFTIPWREREPEWMIMDFTLKPLRNAQGDVAFVLLESRDITQRKRAEEDVARKNAELQELYEHISKLDQLKSIFFAMMNHELRTPLTLILGPTEALLQQASLTAEVRQSLEGVTRNGRLLLKLVNDLLEVSRLESGQLQLHYASCDLSRLVQLLAANFDTVATERRLTYRVQIPPNLLVEVDAAKIERVLLNLLSNAFKFTPDGGRVTCSLEIPSGDQGASAGSASVVLTVQDSGPGVPAELRELIFERFRQTEEGAKRRFGGTGLGLAIVKDLVQLHQGTIHVDEAPGGGACFTIRLPQRAPAGTNVQQQEESAPCVEADTRLSQATVEELLPARPASSQPSRSSWDEQEHALILIVEDHVQMRQFLAEHLSSQYRVMEAANGQEGLTRAREVHPDVILTDMTMPMMSGEEMLIALRADPACVDIPVIMLSARGNEEHRLSILRAGAQDYLVKPFSPEELQVRLGNLLMLHRARRVLQEELASSQENVESLARAMAARSHDLGVLNTQLQALNQQQNNFIAVVSHEFRTALSGIQGFSELLSEQEWSAEEVKEFASDITTDAKRLTRLIDEVLDLERMKSGKAMLNAEPMDMNALLRKLAKQMQQTTSHHTLVCVLDETLPLVQGDQDKVIQVIRNLLSNAVKYSPEGGDIVLRSQRIQNAIQISIQDQGMGIPQEAQKDLFVPYSRIASEHTRYISGSGLGLSVAQEIMSLHGGTIWVESTVGYGSTFHVSLPTSQKTLQPLPAKPIGQEEQI